MAVCWEILVVVLAVPVFGAEVCLLPQAPSTTVTLTSRRNKTGHWNVQVRLEQLAGLEHEDRSAGPWELVVNHGTTRSVGQEVVFSHVTITVPPAPPGPDYELFPGVGYFRYHSTAKTWIEARRTCVQEGAYLAVINSERESRFMVQVLAQHKKNIAHIGFHDRFVEGEFFTVLGTPLNTTGFTRWADQRLPDNGGKIPEPGADCGGIYINGGLHDIVCESMIPFFCEAPE